MEKEYISRAGQERLRAELERLRTVERPRVVIEVSDAAAQGDRSENGEYIYGKKRLREIDRRTRWLEKRLEALMIGDAELPKSQDRCYFGAIVTLEDEDGKATSYRILGADEVDVDGGVISYRSPLGRALLGKAEGDSVVVRTPSGERELTVTGVKYLMS